MKNFLLNYLIGIAWFCKWIGKELYKFFANLRKKGR